VVILALQWLAVKVPVWIGLTPMTQFMFVFNAPIVAAVALVVWWLFASRISWSQRGLGLLVCAAAGAGSFAAYHPSFGGFGLLLYALPTVTTAWVLWLVLTPFLTWPVRFAGLLIVFVLAWGYFDLVRFEGVDGDFAATFHYRWLPTAEDRFMAETAGKRTGEVSAASPALTLQPGDWPGFRGPDRDGRATGIRIATDWMQHPPRLLWKHRVGPGWSSFAVVGTRLYTQEQWKQQEAVVCYDTSTGAEIWSHTDTTRFEESAAGAGPRATPTFHEGRLYTLGAKGQLNCLDAATGRVVWSRDIVADSGGNVPQWGFAASPLITGGIVTVFAGGPENKALLGYQTSTGEPAWAAGEGKDSYCSPHPARVAGVEQVVIATEKGMTAVDPARGAVLWHHDWALEGMARVVQPNRVGEADFLLGMGFGVGTRRVHVRREESVWDTSEVWTTLAIKPYYNDLVVHKGHLYGFDGNFFTCVNLEDGKGKWRARGYGNGQVLLLADQNLLVVLSEKGEVALVEASPGGHKERGRFQAIEGKTWNHPVVAHGKLFVRNGEEAACFQLAEEAVESSVRR
jgi:outer membrane protein assembly factor BamB